ncbi:FIP (Fungus-Induced Protein) Related [Caenorhabditis elegans]|uniref:FIP (Fungus-Induced Protein) Related n=1 Tax=Caenorhabditis elegans TaxID=6239 RepID=I2HAK8_CAEEL|nr:FIP (Fungus-Induced Protein) Related [Caenorhabditis elegans]NP_001263922.1 FIP (Fungus-Induced Protein) Related [Caenorhabditis elegans]CCH63935.1 FIP (Fungus-Induced Protein) Related [Caenorhabditis elegans]CCH63937.1 FIP (Fungus-Induced Protein) Related [Caenorhabditis elegans]|eukprot:NP_001263921.1 Uncharacterized protein CELE_C06H5.13 [Caenorhabditis elegans]
MDTSFNTNFIFYLLVLIACVANFGFCQNTQNAASNIIGHATGAHGGATGAARGAVKSVGNRWDPDD